VLVECRIEGASGRSEMRLTDLSAGGCFVDTSMSFSAGAQLILYAKLGDSEVALPGRVVPVKAGSGFGFAIDLEKLAEPDRERLEAFIKEKSGQ
jgi:hypothetical protein